MILIQGCGSNKNKMANIQHQKFQQHRTSIIKYCNKLNVESERLTCIGALYKRKLIPLIPHMFVYRQNAHSFLKGLNDIIRKINYEAKIWKFYETGKLTIFEREKLLN